MDQSEQCRSTPPSLKMRSAHRHTIEEALAYNLHSPFVDSLVINLWGASTPGRKQPEYLMSPSPIKRDLFSQLLSSDHHAESPLRIGDIIEEDSSSEEDDYSDEESEKEESEMVDENEENENEYSSNDVRKRKRKSTNQIKVLKDHLNGEANWSKEKIAKMSEITGLSQSQVYKWFWDQKKKNNKNRAENCLHPRRIIKKNLGYREALKELNLSNIEEKEEREEREEKEEKGCPQQQIHEKTKVKISGMNEEEEKNTVKKLRKRLIFG